MSPFLGPPCLEELRSIKLVAAPNRIGDALGANEMPRPEDDARKLIDEALGQAGWAVQDADAANLYARRGGALREFPLKQGHGFADYLLYVDDRAAGVVDAKKVATPLTGVEMKTAKYSEGLP